jgi:predicted transcriptional regulator
MADTLTRQQLYDDLVAAYTVPDPPEGAFTVADFAERTGRTRHNAGDILYNLYTEGKIERAKRGKGFWYYYAEQKGE